MIDVQSKPHEGSSAHRAMRVMPLSKNAILACAANRDRHSPSYRLDPACVAFATYLDPGDKLIDVFSIGIRKPGQNTPCNNIRSIVELIKWISVRPSL